MALMVGREMCLSGGHCDVWINRPLQNSRLQLLVLVNEEEIFLVCYRTRKHCNAYVYIYLFFTSIELYAILTTKLSEG